MFIYLIADHDFSFIHHLQLHSSQTGNSWIVKYQEPRAIMILILPSNCLRHLLTHSLSVVGVALRPMQMKAALRIECVQYYWWMKRSVKSLNITLLVCSINADSICNGESFTSLLCVCLCIYRRSLKQKAFLQLPIAIHYAALRLREEIYMPTPTHHS